MARIRYDVGLQCGYGRLAEWAPLNAFACAEGALLAILIAGQLERVQLGVCWIGRGDWSGRERVGRQKRRMARPDVSTA